MSTTDPTFISEGLFPTFIHVRDLPDVTEMNAELLTRIREIQAEDPKGTERSNIPGLGGWHSQSNLHRDPACAKMCERVGDTMSTVAERLGLDPRTKLTLLDMWSIVNPRGSSNTAHIHPGSHFSGVYYIQVPPEGGALTLIDPRTEARMLPLMQSEAAKKTRAHMHHVPLNPVAGRMIIFPSWLMHRVEPNLTTLTGPESERVIISFNIGQTSPS